MNHLFRLILLIITYRFRSPCEIFGPCRTSFRVTPSDMDVLFHMNNGKYLSIMDLGRIDMTLRSGFYHKFKKKGWYPVIAEQTIQYLRSIEAFQKFEIVTQIIGGDEKGLLLSQNFECDGKLMARAVVRARFLKKSGGKVTTDELLSITDEDTRLPQEPDWVKSWSQDMQLLRKNRKG